MIKILDIYTDTERSNAIVASYAIPIKMALSQSSNPYNTIDIEIESFTEHHPNQYLLQLSSSCLLPRIRYSDSWLPLYTAHQ